MAGLLAACACLIVIGMRLAGWLEPLELHAYDHYLRAQATRHAADPRIALIGATEEDLNRWGWPLSDQTLAQALARLAAHRPAAIGVDLYRDRPREPGAEQLQQILQANPNIIAVTKIGAGREAGIPAPAYLAPEQVGFADVPLDRADIVRRGLLFLDDGTDSYTGFALRLALLYLQPRGIGLAAGEPDPSHLRIGPHTLPPFEPDDGGYVGADAGGYQFLLDYAGGPSPFKQFTLSELLDGQIPDDALAGKIIVLGVTSQSVKDFFATPFSHGEFLEQTVYGIAMHGHAISQLIRIALDEAPPRQVWSEGREAAWIALWCLLGALLGIALRTPAPFVATLILGWGLLYASGHLALAQALWLPVVPAALAWGVAAILTIGYLSVLERRQRHQLMQLFSRYVSRDVAADIWNHQDQLLASGGRPQTRRLEVTVLFSDIRGFTSISEQMPPGQLMTWLNQYIEAMTDLVGAHGGMVDKFIGDAVMAVFGAPLPRQNPLEIASDATHAVDCALAMGEKLAALNRGWQEEGLPPIAIRIGINTGTVIAGSIGSADKLEYTIIGDAVNIASRLESMDKEWPGLEGGEHCRVFVSASTMRHLGNRYLAREVGGVRLKGKAQAVGVYRVTGHTSQPPAGNLNGEDHEGS